MTTIAIIGGPSSGKTVVAGLMYEAATIAKSGLIKEHDFSPSREDEDLNSWKKKKTYGKFDFEMGSDITTLNYLRNNIIVPLRSGEFPGATAADELQLLRFDFRIPSIFGAKTHPIGIYEIGGEKVQKILGIISEAKDKGTILRSIKGENLLHALLQSDVFVILVNSAVCEPISYKEIKNAQKSLQKRTESDFDTALLLTAIRNYKQYMDEKIKSVGILFTMHDRVSATVPLKTTQQYEDAIRNSMHSTWTQFSYIKKDFKINDVKYFKSGIEIRTDEEEQTEKPNMPLHFYIREYLELLYWLINI